MTARHLQGEGKAVNADYGCVFRLSEDLTQDVESTSLWIVKYVEVHAPSCKTTQADGAAAAVLPRRGFCGCNRSTCVYQCDSSHCCQLMARSEINGTSV